MCTRHPHLKSFLDISGRTRDEWEIVDIGRDPIRHNYDPRGNHPHPVSNSLAHANKLVQNPLRFETMRKRRNQLVLNIGPGAFLPIADVTFCVSNLLRKSR